MNFCDSHDDLSFNLNDFSYSNDFNVQDFSNSIDQYSFLDSQNDHHDDDHFGISRLCKAIFLQQLIDAFSTSKKKQNLRNKQNAINWLTLAINSGELESFLKVCGVNTRKGVNTIKEKLGLRVK